MRAGIQQARGRLVEAAQAVAEGASLYAEAVSGTSDPVVADLPRNAAVASSAVAGHVVLLDSASDLLEAYLKGIGASQPDSPPVLPGSSGTSQKRSGNQLDGHRPSGGDKSMSAADKARYSGPLIEVRKPDAHADRLANRIGGVPRRRFSGDPNEREFDAVSDEYVAQAKPGTVQVNKAFRAQAKATFEAARATGRSVYYHFDGSPNEEVMRRLREYAKRYDVDLVIDDTPFEK